ncbi:uncharacterized protein BCR38DRAFT_465095 [Pseudomassariella vexata]|uniref:NADAR domain-containing protein n=1 Tax=Pseudomassariella vexata TaxID=1141098 RepID=A0A1Y2E482_9PEZI|nr:uncharacterized protein BCR38DRAFT_465095 [Pseudomassariella vexata]ORY66096.1 hypothetical protein BCR38DRAFT_465095 [Pseudomassariella vexata]
MDSSVCGPLFFYRERHPRTGFLSQWFNQPFRDPSSSQLEIYPTAEHYMMHHKALLFNDTENAAAVLHATTPRDVKAIGRRVRGFDKDIWEREREGIVRRGNYLKFTYPVAAAEEDKGRQVGWRLGDVSNAVVVRSTSFREALLATGDRELIEASPWDGIWGIEFSEEDASKHTSRERWGLNLLGKCLTAVREEFKQDKLNSEGKARSSDGQPAKNE